MMTESNNFIKGAFDKGQPSTICHLSAEPPSFNRHPPMPFPKPQLPKTGNKENLYPSIPGGLKNYTNPNQGFSMTSSDDNNSTFCTQLEEIGNSYQGCNPYDFSGAQAFDRSRALVRPTVLGETPNFRNTQKPGENPNTAPNCAGGNQRRRSSDQQSQRQVHQSQSFGRSYQCFGGKEVDQSNKKSLNNSASLSLLETCDVLNTNGATVAYARHCQMVADLAQSKKENCEMKKRIKELEETIRNETINYEEQRAFIEMLKETINEKLDSLGIFESLKKASKQIVKHNQQYESDKRGYRLPECGSPVDLYLEIVNMKNNVDFLELELEKCKNGSIESKMAVGHKEKSIKELEGLVCSLEKNEKRVMDYLRRIQRALGSEGRTDLPSLGFVEGEQGYESFYHHQDIVAVIEAMKKKSKEDDENIFEMNETIQQLQRDSQEIQGENQGLGNELEALRENETRMIERVGELESLIEEVSSENKELRESLKSEGEAAKQLEEGLSKMERVREENAGLKKAKELCEENLRKEFERYLILEKETEELKRKAGDMEKWKALAEEAEKQWKAAEAEIQRQHERIKKDEETICEMKREVEGLSLEMERKGGMIERMTHQFDGSAGENKKLIEQNARLMIENRNVNHKIKEIANESQSLKESLSEMSKQEQILSSKCSELSEKLKNAQADVEILKNIRDSDEEAVSFLMNQLPIKDVCNGVDSLEQLVFVSLWSGRKRQDTKKEKDTPKEILDTLKKMPETLKSIESKVKSLTESEKTLRSKQIALSKGKEEAANQSDQLKCALDETKIYLEELEKEFKTTREERDLLSSKCQELLLESEKLKEELDALKNEHQQISEYTDDLLTNTEELKEANKNLASKLESRTNHVLQREDTLLEQIYGLKQEKTCLESCLRKARAFLWSEETRNALDEYQETLARIIQKESEKSRENAKIELNARASESEKRKEKGEMIECIERLKTKRNIAEEKLEFLLKEETARCDKNRDIEFLVNKLKIENAYLKEELDNFKVLAQNDARRSRMTQGFPMEKSKDRFTL